MGIGRKAREEILEDEYSYRDEHGRVEDEGNEEIEDKEDLKW
jgi:hypothetical protein